MKKVKLNSKTVSAMLSDVRTSNPSNDNSTPHIHIFVLRAHLPNTSSLSIHPITRLSIVPSPTFIRPSKIFHTPSYPMLTPSPPCCILP